VSKKSLLSSPLVVRRDLVLGRRKVKRPLRSTKRAPKPHRLRGGCALSRLSGRKSEEINRNLSTKTKRRGNKKRLLSGDQKEVEGRKNQSDGGTI